MLTAAHRIEERDQDWWDRRSRRDRTEERDRSPSSPSMIASLAGAGPPSSTAAGLAALIAAVKAIDPSTPRAAKADPDPYCKLAAAQPPLKGSVAKAAIAAKREVYGKKVVDGGKPSFGSFFQHGLNS